MIVFGEAHLRQILMKYAAYYNELRTHRSLDKTLRSIAPSSTPAALCLRPSSAAFITVIAESDFRYRQAETGRGIEGATERVEHALFLEARYVRP